MTHRIRDWKPGKVLVVGDVMLDQYWDGTTRRISPEAPVPIVKVESEIERVGGAANVAANVVALGVEVELIGGIGTDSAGRRLQELCTALDIEAQFISSANCQTTLKLRVLSQHQQLLRLDFEAQNPAYDSEKLLQVFVDKLAAANVVVLSDYGKGFIKDCQSLILAATEAGKRVIVDPKSENFSHYAGAYVITPNLAEFETCVGRCENDHDIIERGLQLCRQHDFGAVLITRGEHGMTLVAPDRSSFTLTAKARDVFDVTGAGDTVCAVVASALAAGAELADAIVYANAAAGIVVGKLGTATVNLIELEQALAFDSELSCGIVTIATLLPQLARAKHSGEKIVMTNGCFDILHAGHVAYLEQAKIPGSRLIVALNSDASVARLKGQGRPVHALQDRMKVINGLAVVDWVISFDDDTPLNLIEAISPDVLVKGGDYAVDEIVGAKHVLDRGGEVVVLPFVDGHSTSSIIKQLSTSKQ